MATILVTTDYATIADAVAAATAGDTIVVESGFATAEVVSVSVNGLTFQGDTAQTGIQLVLGGAVSSITLDGTTTFDVVDHAGDVTILGANGSSTNVTINGGNDAVHLGEGVGDNDALVINWDSLTENVTAAIASGSGTLTTEFASASLDFSGVETVTLNTGIGNDSISTGSQLTDETINSGDGNDTITVAGGNDVVDLGSGAVDDDVLIVNWAATTGTVIGNLSTGTGGLTNTDADYSVSVVDAEHFSITSGSGSDTILTGAGNDTLNGGGGNDTLTAGDGLNVLNGGAGNDSLTGGADDDTLNGGDADGHGNDTLTGAGGSDIATISGGSDTVDLGAGGTGDNDRLVVDWSATTGNVTAGYTSYATTLAENEGYGSFANSQSGYAATFSGVEHFTVTTGNGNDAFTTGSGDDVISTGGGNDSITAGAGKITFDGGAGIDFLSADLGAETVDIQLDLAAALPGADIGGGNAIANVERITLTTGSGNDTITTFDGYATAGTTDDDALDDAINTGTGNDAVLLYGGNDNVTMGDGGTLDDDLLVVDWRYTTGNVSGGYTSYSTTQAENEGYGTFGNTDLADSVTFSGVERMFVTTGSGNDTIGTGDGNDSVELGSGNDSVNTRLGTANVIGGAGIDHWQADISASGADVTLNLNTALITENIGGGSFVTEIERITLTTGAGNDTITTFDGYATPGTTDDDALDDSVTTGAGNDAVLLYGGNDQVTMGDGGTLDDDLLVVDWRNTAGNVTGGYSSYSGPQGDNDSYGTFSNTDAADSVTFYGVERFFVTTGSGADNFGTGDGDDSVSLGSGNDSVNTRTGNATVNGGDGIDFWQADLSAETVAVSLNLNTALIAEDIGGGNFVAGIERIYLTTGAGNDTITTFDGVATGVTDDDALDDTVTTGAGNDSVVLTGGNDTVDLGLNTTADDDLLVINWGHLNGNVTGGVSSYAGDFANRESYGTLANADTNHSVSFNGVERLSLITGGGADSITASYGDDTILSGAGNDTINAQIGKISIDGGMDIDYLLADLSAESADIVLNLDTAAIDEDIGGGNYVAGIERINLTTGGGNDTITTFNGAATLGTTADDALDDAVTTGAGSDTVVVTGGNDTVTLGENGTADDDLLVINWGHLSGNVTGGASSYNGVLTNLETYGNFASTLTDHSLSFSGAERLNITTGSGNDVFNAGYGNDTVVSGSGDDTIDTRTGKVSLNGGLGTDYWQGDLSAETANIAFALNTASINTDIGGGNYIAGIERIFITTGSGNDTLTTFDARLTAITTDDALDDNVTTSAGSDEVTFFGGNDSAAMGQGGTADDDVLRIDWSHLSGNVTGGYSSYAGVQANKESYGTFSNTDANHSVAFTDVERISIITGAGDDFYSTGLGNDTISSGTGDDTVAGGDGDDVISAVGDGMDSLVGGNGINTAQVDYSLSTSGVSNSGNLLSAGAYGTTSFTSISHFDLTLSHFNDSVTGWGGNDTLTGNGGDDLLNGAAGLDVIYGDAGADTLIGGMGNDYIDGGTENDLIHGDSLPTAFDGTGIFTRPASLVHGTMGAAVDLTAMFAVASVTDPEIDGSGTLPTVSVGVDGSTSADLHWYSFTVGASGGTVTVDIDHGSEDGVNPSFDTYLRIYDASGTQVAFNDDSASDAGSTSSNSYVTFTGTAGATYYVKVSRYSDNVIATTADYELQVTLPSVATAGGSDILSGGAGDDTLYGGAGVDSLSGGDDNDLLDADAGDDMVWGDDGDDTLIGDAGNDTLVGGLGFDTVDYSASSDAVTVSLDQEVPVLVSASQGTDEFNSIEAVTGSAFADSITGDGQGNLLTGGNGSDTLRGGSGADTMNGGLGDDAFYVDNAGDQLGEGAGEGTDTAFSTIGYSIAGFAHVEKLTLLGTASNSAEGNSLDNTLTGNAGDNLLDGLAGADTMIGGGGDDTYYVDNAGDVVTEAFSAGTDEVRSSITFSLADLANLEHLTLTGSDAINGTGNAGNNRITGNAGNNTLDGNTGIDTLIGGAGNDVFITEGDDIITENSGEGIDEVRTASTYSLASLIFVENLVLTGTASVNATGNAGGNVLTGNSGDNLLDGGAATDTMVGGAGNDTYIVDATGDVVTELAAGGTDEVQASVNYSLAPYGQVEKLTLTGSASINATGNGLANTLTGNGGNNTLDGGSGADTMIGLAGDDIYIVDNAGDIITEGASGGADEARASVTYSIAAFGEVENLVLTGSANINATGNAKDNQITGNAGGNTLDGGTGGTDTLTGGAGNDIYITDGNDVIVEGSGGGIDEIRVNMNYSLVDLDFVENLMLTGNFNTWATGNANANLLTGDASNNRLDGGAGIDTMVGGAGNDTYLVDSLSEVVTELAGGGTDEIQTALTYSLAALVNVENLTLTGTGAINATGNALANTLTGNIGNNTLDGGAGIDTMAGGAGNDTYIIDNAADVVTELASAGTDEVKASVTYSIATYVNVEKLTLTGTGHINATGSTIGNTITGNAGNNTLDGLAGADTMYGGAGNDIFMIENVGDIPVELVNEGTDEVRSTITFSLANHIFIEKLTLLGSMAINATGNLLANTLTGNAAGNTLDGGAGIDTMIGGAGNDIYIVDNAADVVTELASQGLDEVRASVTYSLATSAQTEKLTLTGTANLNATGNALANTLTGNAGINTLDGGAGADTMTGLGGNDTYVVDNTGDVVIEAAGGGTDTVNSSITYSIAALVNVEHVTLLGAASINATGNALGNTLTGNSGGNTLDGGAGADTMTGGLGNDIYIVDNIGDRVMELVGQGTDEIRSSVTYSLLSSANTEKLTLTGVAAINATGNLLANTIVGNAAANVIEGRAGNDILTGGGGADTFVFADLAGASNTDTITDFVSSTDKIKLDDGAFAGIGALGALGAARFVVGTVATDAADRIVYDKMTGKLYYDADGSGAGAKVQFAQVTANLTLAHTDFLII